MRSPLIAAAFILGASAALAAPAPDELAQSMVSRLQHELDSRQDEFRNDSAKLHRTVDALLSPHFDFAYIAQLVLARHWRTATPQQRDRFQEAFKHMLIRSYASALLEISSSGKVSWQAAHPAPDATEVTVRSNVLRDNGRTLPVALLMRRRGGDWKIYDITVETVSLVSSFRGQIGSQIRQGGIDALIEKLEAGAGPAPAAGTPRQGADRDT